MNQQNIINPSVYSGYLTCVKKIESILFTSGLADGNIEMDLFIFFFAGPNVITVCLRAANGRGLSGCNACVTT